MCQCGIEQDILCIEGRPGAEVMPARVQHAMFDCHIAPDQSVSICSHGRRASQERGSLTSKFGACEGPAGCKGACSASQLHPHSSVTGGPGAQPWRDAAVHRAEPSDSCAAGSHWPAIQSVRWKLCSIVSAVEQTSGPCRGQLLKLCLSC